MLWQAVKLWRHLNTLCALDIEAKELHFVPMLSLDDWYVLKRVPLSPLQRRALQVDSG